MLNSLKNKLNGDGTILYNEKYIWKTLILSFIISSIPMILLHEEDIKNIFLLNEIMKYGVNYFPIIEYYARNASFNNLYYTIKLQLSFGLVSLGVVFIYSLVFLIKLYLFNLGYIKLDKKKYFNQPINDYSTSVNFSRYISQSIFFIVILGIFFIISQVPKTIEHEYVYLKESTVIGAYVIVSILSASFGALYSYFFIETIAQIRKYLKLKLKINEDKD